MQRTANPLMPVRFRPGPPLNTIAYGATFAIKPHNIFRRSSVGRASDC